MPFRALAVSFIALVTLTASGCGSDDGGEPKASTTTAPTASVPSEAPTVLALYFIRDGKVGLARRSVVAGAKPASDAMGELLAGPTREDRAAGLGTAIPPGTSLERVVIADGVATVELSRELSPEAIAQVVYTLTAFPTVSRVDHGADTPVGRADLEDLAPRILVESPAPGEQASSPLRITGTANTFEATFIAQVVDSSGRVVGERFVTATSGSGQRGTFDATLPFEARRGPGKLVVFEESAEGGGKRLGQVEIPLELVP